jgi:hypothetical protein
LGRNPHERFNRSKRYIPLSRASRVVQDDPEFLCHRDEVFLRHNRCSRGD